jgi:hypothetical protein
MARRRRAARARRRSGRNREALEGAGVQPAPFHTHPTCQVRIGCPAPGRNDKRVGSCHRRPHDRPGAPARPGPGCRHRGPEGPRGRSAVSCTRRSLPPAARPQCPAAPDPGTRSRGIGPDPGGDGLAALPPLRHEGAHTFDAAWRTAAGGGDAMRNPGRRPAALLSGRSPVSPAALGPQADGVINRYPERTLQSWGGPYW